MTPQIALYNTLTRTKTPFAPMDANNVRMYVCGPTVYDFAHIGNARPVIVFDVLFRLLRHVYGESHVTYVRNITDVDDKINARALRDFPDLPLNEAIRKVTEKTENQFLADVKALGTLQPTHQPRATDNITEMQTLISALIEKNHAYNAGGEVLFRTRSMEDYGQLSGRNLEDNLAGARVAVEAHKEDPADFVLWKLSSETEPGWPSPWGRGRPGWHIECSAMSERYLGQTFDIHGGGLDLIFPHHENEIAQSRCAHGTHAMANVWMHNGFLQVEGQKMSKSLGNFVTINELLESEKFGGRRWSGEVLRLAMLMTHYREPIDFSVRRLEEAEKKLLNWKQFAAGRASHKASQSVVDYFLKILSDDLNTPNAFAFLDDIVSGYDERRGHRAAVHQILKLIGFRRFNTDAFNGAKAVMQALTALESIEPQHWGGYFQTVVSAPKFLSGKLKSEARLIVALEKLLHDYESRRPDSFTVPEGLTDEVLAHRWAESKLEIMALRGIRERLAALNAKDFAKADAIRNDLAEQGIALLDYKDEQGQRATKWEVKR